MDGDSLNGDGKAELALARATGRKEGLATAAVAVGLICFLNLLGAEKGLLALLLGILAIRSKGMPVARKRAQIAIALAILQFVTITVLLYLFHDRLHHLIESLRQLS